MRHVERLTIPLLVFGVLLFGSPIPSCSAAGGPAGVTILDVVWEELPEQYLIHLKTSGKPNYSLHELFRPLRVAIDFADASLGQMKLPLDIPRGPVTHIESRTLDEQAGAKGQGIVLYLSEEMVYSVDPAGNGLVLRFPRKAEPPRDPAEVKSEKKKPEGERTLISASSLSGGANKSTGKPAKSEDKSKASQKTEKKSGDDRTQAEAGGKQAPAAEKVADKKKESGAENEPDNAAPGAQLIPGILDENPIVVKPEPVREPATQTEKSATTTTEKGKEGNGKEKAAAQSPPKEEKSMPSPGSATKSKEARPPTPAPATQPARQPASPAPLAQKAEEEKKTEKPKESDAAGEKAAPPVSSEPRKTETVRKKSGKARAKKSTDKAGDSSPSPAALPPPGVTAQPSAGSGSPEGGAASGSALVGVEPPPRKGEEGVRVRLRGDRSLGDETGAVEESMIMTPGAVFRPRR